MIPNNIVVHQQSKVLELPYENGNTYRLPFELLRVLSPSAEVRGHGPGQETLQTGKREVLIANLEPVGHYVQHLCENQEQLWKEHLDKLAAAGLDRDAPMMAKDHMHDHSCGSH